MTLFQCSVSCLLSRTRTNLHTLPKCHRNVRLSWLPHCNPHYAISSILLWCHFLGGHLGYSLGVMLLLLGWFFWDIGFVFMIFAGDTVFHSYYFGGLFLLVVMMLHHTFSFLSFLYLAMTLTSDKWAPVTTAWCILRLQMEDQPPIWSKYIEQKVMDSWQWGSPVWGLGKVLTTPHRNNTSCYEMFTLKTLDLNWSSGMT